MENKINKKELDKQKRIENLEQQKEKLLKQGYKDYIKTMSVFKINLMAFVTAGPFALIALIICLIVWGEISFEYNLGGNLALLALLILSIPVHEFLHGITWCVLCKRKWKSIKFGIMWDSLTPYCHCKEPLSYGSYMLGCLMPFFLLGIGVTCVGIIYHNLLILLIGILNILSAGGDTTIAYMSIKYRKCIIIDHPTECGFIAFCKEEHSPDPR